MFRTTGIKAAVLFISVGAPAYCSAQQAALSAAGYTGLSVTPTANLLPWGSGSIAYDRQVVGGPTVGRIYTPYGTSGHNFVAGIGLLPFLEISGRLASNTIQSNCYTEGCGIRDLSFNFKAGLALDSDKTYKVAVGANDFGGQVNYFRTFYGVATYNTKELDVSLGYSQRASNLLGRATPLNGAFGSIAYKPFNWIETHIEYNDRKAWVGSKLYAPAEWLPQGWAAYIGANVRVLGQENLTSKSWISAGITVPFYKVPVEKAPEGRLNPARLEVGQEQGYAQQSEQTLVTKPHVREFTSSGLMPSAATNELITSQTYNLRHTIGADVDKNPSDVSEAELVKISEDLRVKGFEDIRVGRLPSTAIAISVNNATYNVNTIDGLGVALGVIARNIGDRNVGYSLLLTQRQTPIVAVTGKANCLADWIVMRPPLCEAGQFHTPGFSNISDIQRGAVWSVDGKAPSWKTVRLTLQPVLSTAIATEYGVLDYSAAVRATVQQPLWAGGYFEVARTVPFSNSRDYDDNQVFGRSRLKNETDRVLIHQVIRLPLERIFGADGVNDASKMGLSSLTAHIAAGKIDASYRGFYSELRWEPFNGRHRFGLENGFFNRITPYDPLLPKMSRPALASYRINFPTTRTDVEMTYGRFLYNDNGAQFSIKQWFDDVAINLYLRRTKFSETSSSRTVAGIEVQIPLTPRKDMTPTYGIQVTGVPQWVYGLETKVGGANFISNAFGVSPGLAILDKTFNADRAGVDYFVTNMARIRSAASY